MTTMRATLAAIVALTLAQAALAATAPRVRLMDWSPATVGGTGFKAGERVAVTVHGGSLTLSKQVRTNVHGSFTARFLRDISNAPCTQVAIKAVGARGDSAAWKTPPETCGAQPAPNQ